MGLISVKGKPYETRKFVDSLRSHAGYEPVVNLPTATPNVTAFIPSDKSHEYPSPSHTFENITFLNIAKYHVLGHEILVSSMTGNVSVTQPLLNDTDMRLVIQTNSSYQQGAGNGVNTSDITYKNMVARNGYLNVIDSLLIPPLQPEIVICQAHESPVFVHLANRHPNIIDLLNNSKNFTLLCPSDTALRRVGLIGMSNETITNLILSHMVRGVYYSTDFTEQAEGKHMTVTNLLNTTISISVKGSSILANNTATIEQHNILFNNGVMHLINKVLDNTVT
ncbi:FAS1 domain-containing protein [Pilobolus umbonatus]|nr:FAS1 domain-containing protein [Pilobolus umbonatus]